MSINGCDFFTCVPWWMHFSRELLKDNDMIPREIWCTSALVNFFNDYQKPPTLRAQAIFSSLDNLLYRQIAIEIMLLYE